MSIREYKEGEHNAGFIGLRVTVKVGQDYRQKYFNFKKLHTEDQQVAAWKEARQINADWNLERQLLQSKKGLDSHERRRVSSAYTTGVSGVKMKFSYTAKKLASGTKRYYMPCFLVSGSTAGRRYGKLFNVLSLGYELAWFKAISYYAEQKQIKNYDHLLSRKPPVEQFYVVYRYQYQNGHTIPYDKLPNELDPQVLIDEFGE